jgi:hypothetical protein
MDEKTLEIMELMNRYRELREHFSDEDICRMDLSEDMKLARKMVYRQDLFEAMAKLQSIQEDTYIRFVLTAENMVKDFLSFKYNLKGDDVINDFIRTYPLLYARLCEGFRNKGYR